MTFYRQEPGQGELFLNTDNLSQTGFGQCFATVSTMASSHVARCKRRRLDPHDEANIDTDRSEVGLKQFGAADLPVALLQHILLRVPFKLRLACESVVIGEMRFTSWLTTRPAQPSVQRASGDIWLSRLSARAAPLSELELTKAGAST